MVHNVKNTFVSFNVIRRKNCKTGRVGLSIYQDLFYYTNDEVTFFHGSTYVKYYYLRFSQIFTKKKNFKTDEHFFYYYEYIYRYRDKDEI